MRRFAQRSASSSAAKHPWSRHPGRAEDDGHHAGPRWPAVTEHTDHPRSDHGRDERTSVGEDLGQGAISGTMAGGGRIMRNDRSHSFRSACEARPRPCSPRSCTCAPTSSTPTCRADGNSVWVAPALGSSMGRRGQHRRRMTPDATRWVSGVVYLLVALPVESTSTRSLRSASVAPLPHSPRARTPPSCTCRLGPRILLPEEKTATTVETTNCTSEHDARGLLRRPSTDFPAGLRSTTRPRRHAFQLHDYVGSQHNLDAGCDGCLTRDSWAQMIV